MINFDALGPVVVTFVKPNSNYGGPPCDSYRAEPHGEPVPVSCNEERPEWRPAE